MPLLVSASFLCFQLKTDPNWEIRLAGSRLVFGPYIGLVGELKLFDFAEELYQSTLSGDPEAESKAS